MTCTLYTCCEITYIWSSVFNVTVVSDPFDLDILCILNLIKV